MSNYEMNAFLDAGLPPGIKKLSGLETALYLIICHRYDTREFANGRRNRGYLKSYPGMELFQRVTGMSRSAIEGALATLKEKGLITQVEKGYRGNTACYIPIYSINLLTHGESVAYADTIDNEVSSTPAESVSNTDIESPAYAHKVSSTPVTISTVSTVSNNKYDLFRFNLVLRSLPERLRTISPGPNFEKLLNECDELGITTEIQRVLAGNKWDNITGNAGGIVSKLIKDAIERKRAGLPVSAPVQVTPTPPNYEPDNREVNPPSAETEKLIEMTKAILKGVRSIPD
jgi:DNA-binding transcriptional ArsR family regulator